MAVGKRQLIWRLGLLVLGVGGALVSTFDCALAQRVVPDTTLPQNSAVTVNGNNFTITGGTQVGSNLFHSFSQFSVPTHGEAFFNNGLTIQNIISRVTGLSASNIDGILRTNGTANLFLLNPNGIVFGPNARLNVGGSFVASTASKLKFADMSEFTTTSDALSPPLLTISTPMGLQLGRGGSAVVNAGNLSVNPGQNITLFGSTVINTGQVKAPGGEVTLAAAPTASEARLGQSGALLSLQVQETQAETQATFVPELLVNIPGLVVNANNQIELAGIPVSNQIGTAINAGNIDVSSQIGGTVKILGTQVALYPNALSDASGDRGGGKVLLGGDYQGQGELLKATATYVSPTATIQANAQNSGNGGNIVVWSDQSTRAYGKLQARGGAQSGHGGLVETSSLKFLDVAGITVDASATKGNGGTWLLDPRNVTLGYSGTSNGSLNGSNPNIFTPTGDSATIDIPDIQSQLNTGTNVTISTGSTGTQDGNISGQGFGISKTTASPVTLTLQAANDITLNSFGINSNNGALNIVLAADSNHSGRGNLNISDGGIQTAGGQFTASAGTIALKGIGLNSDNTSSNNAAPITLTANAIALENLGITSTTTGNGNASGITLNANSVEFKKTGIGSTTSGTGNAGLITINTKLLSLGTDPTGQGSGINSVTSGSGSTLGINVTADSILLDKSGISSMTKGSGNTSPINVTANSISFLGQSGINSATEGNGQASTININAGKLSVQNEGGITSNTKGNGNAGAVNITADTIDIANKVGISSNTQAGGNAGPVTIKTGLLSIKKESGLSSEAQLNSTGNAGAIDITAKSIQLNDSGGISSNTFGLRDAGNITIKTGDLSILGQNSGISSDARENSKGNAGNINITADTILGESGTLGNGILSETRSSGNSGAIKLQTNSLVLRNKSNITTSTFDRNSTGNAGRVEITANSILFENNIPNAQSGVGSVTRGNGSAGEIILNADTVVLGNQGGIGLNTFGAGDAGKLTLKANSLLMENAAIGSSNQGSGKGGEVNIQVGTASLKNSIIDTNTFGSKPAGLINIKADSLNLDNNSILKSNTSGSGSGGNINLTIDGALTLGGSTISVSSTAPTNSNTQPGTAGNIDIRARSVRLENQSQLFADTDSGNGGDIKLQLQDFLLMRRNSQISATAGNAFAGGNGGNIKIDTPFIITLPQENSDLTANAFNGLGGNVTINAQSLFSIAPLSQQELERLRPQDLDPRQLPTNDITAISRTNPDLRGQVTINTPDVDPSRGLVALPTVVVNAPELVASSCAAFAEEGGSKFIVTGRGGLPPTPDEPLSPDVVWSDTRDPSTISQHDRSKTPTVKPSSKTKAIAIVPATGWVFNGKGEVTLISSAPNATTLGSTPATCPKFK